MNTRFGFPDGEGPDPFRASKRPAAAAIDATTTAIRTTPRHLGREVSAAIPGLPAGGGTPGWSAGGARRRGRPGPGPQVPRADPAEGLLHEGLELEQAERRLQPSEHAHQQAPMDRAHQVAVLVDQVPEGTVPERDLE